MELQNAQISATEAALDLVLPFNQPADAVLSHFFHVQKSVLYV
jgi:hypothetical protein